MQVRQRSGRIDEEMLKLTEIETEENQGWDDYQEFDNTTVSLNWFFVYCLTSYSGLFHSCRDVIKCMNSNWLQNLIKS